MAGKHHVRCLGAMLVLACLSSSVLGFVVGPNQAILNALTTQQQTFAAGQNQEQNPYGLAAITFSKGNLVKGNFLATNWNDANGNPGQGHTILQVTPQGQVSTFATINPQHPKVLSACGTQGVGLTMALVILSKGYVIVGSTPIAINANVAGAGCLILLDSQGNLLDTHASNEQTSSKTMTGGGPWGMAVQEYNNGANANLFVSYVLGANPASNDTLTGQQGGMVVRYGLQLPGGVITPQFWGNTGPDVIATGFPTQPGQIKGGAVGPAGLVVASSIPTSPYNPHLLDNQLFIGNTLNNSVSVVKHSTSCFIWNGANPQCVTKPVAWLGLVNQPIGLALSPYGTIVGANGGIGTLFEVAPIPRANLQLANQLVDNGNTQDTVAGQGNLFNVLFHPMVPNTLFFNDDAANSFNTLTRTATSTAPNSNGSSGKSKHHHNNRRLSAL